MPRRISDQDRALWRRVNAETVPLRPKPTDEERPSRSLAAPAPFSERPSRPLPLPGTKAAPKPSPLSRLTRFEPGDPDPTQIRRPEPGIDRRTADRLRRGERAPDARIDLHGLTADRAHRRLDRFIAQALMQNLRCVLVITGKGGKHSGEDAPFMRSDRGILRQSVPRWLRAGPHAARIVGIFTAHPRHGGEGALYVYLKKTR